MSHKHRPIEIEMAPTLSVEAFVVLLCGLAAVQGIGNVTEIKVGHVNPATAALAWTPPAVKPEDILLFTVTCVNANCGKYENLDKPTVKLTNLKKATNYTANITAIVGKDASITLYNFTTLDKDWAKPVFNLTKLREGDIGVHYNVSWTVPKNEHFQQFNAVISTKKFDVPIWGLLYINATFNYTVEYTFNVTALYYVDVVGTIERWEVLKFTPSKDKGEESATVRAWAIVLIILGVVGLVGVAGIVVCLIKKRRG